MAGYDGFSKSNNAREAEAAGRYPATEAARRLGVPVGAVRALLRGREWHHTSGWYNRTDYYNISDLEAEDLEALRAWRPPARREESHDGCSVVYLIWTGTRNHPRAREGRVSDARVRVSGQTCRFAGPDGVEVVKRLGTCGFVVTLADGRRLG